MSGLKGAKTHHCQKAVRFRTARPTIHGCLTSLRTLAIAGALVLSLPALAAHALTLKDAIAIAVESNPEIGASIENREAIDFELRQAHGLRMPRLDFEASTGVRRLDNPSRRLSGIENRSLTPTEASLVMTLPLLDSGRISSEIARQASRVDGAAFRVLERSEFIGLQVAREYFEILLQTRIVSLARENVQVHERILGEIREAERGGTLTAADTLQAQERVVANRARLLEAQEELSAAKIRFEKFVGLPVNQVFMPPSVRNALPGSLDDAIGIARRNNPRLLMANADVAAADAVKRAARAERGPELFLEGRARAGSDLDGVRGRSTDLQGRVVFRMNLYDGGINSANYQEQIRRASEERYRQHQAYRDVEEAIRLSWDRRRFQTQILSELRQQLDYSNRVVSSYEEQFEVGRRSLLDVLDAYNTRYNSSVLTQTAEFAIAFADYRLLAATGRLIETLGVNAPHQAQGGTRQAEGVPESSPAVTAPRQLPPRNPFR